MEVTMAEAADMEEAMATAQADEEKGALGVRVVLVEVMVVAADAEEVED